MGFYLERRDGAAQCKAQGLIDDFGAELINKTEAGDLIKSNSKDFAVICVIDNGNFEAAAYVFNQAEYEVFTDPDDTRLKKWLKMERSLCRKICNYPWDN